MILITGATGLVGSHLLYRLLSLGNQVRIIIRDRRRMAGIQRVFACYDGNPEAMLQNLSIVEGDLLDYHTIEDALEGVDRVYHCAATVSYQPSEKEELILKNTAIAANVVNACLEKKVGKLVHVSSTAALGHTTDGSLITEETTWTRRRSSTGYSISKHLAEREVWRGEAEGLQVVIVNPAVVLGPGNWGESSTAIIRKCYTGLRFYTTGGNACVDVRDVADAMIQLMESSMSGEQFLLAGENITFKDLFKSITAALGKPAPRIKAHPWMGELVWRFEKARSIVTRKTPLITKESARTAMACHCYSSGKIIKMLGFTFRPLQETVEWTCSHFLREQGR